MSEPPQRPGSVPRKFWEEMSTEERVQTAAASKALEDGIGHIEHAANARHQAIGLRVTPQAHDQLDRLMADERMKIELHRVRFDQVMWRVMYDLTQRQREADQRVQRITLGISFVSLIASVLVAVLK